MPLGVFYKYVKLIFVFCYVFMMQVYFVIGQNLVPNPGFEQYKKLPEEDGEFTLLHWFNPSHATEYNEKFGTPDYFHRGSEFGCCRLPESQKGTVVPKEQGVVGLITFNGYIANFREYISIKLNETLVPGKEYQVSFLVNVNLKNLTNPYGNLYSSGLGVLFSKTALTQSGNQLIDLQPQYAQQEILKPLGWEKIEFKFTPNEAFQYLNIGNFFEDNRTSTQQFTDKEAFPYAYYFIDNVMVLSPQSQEVKDEMLSNEISETIEKVEVGPDQWICGLEPTRPLEAIVKLSTGNMGAGRWSGGSGKFNNPALPDAIYHPIEVELGKQIELSYTASGIYLGNKPISSLVGTLRLKISNPIEKVDAGKDVIVKPEEFPIRLCGSVELLNGEAGQGYWEGGLGILQSSNNDCFLYYPAKSEIGKSVKLKYVAKDPDGQGPCEGGVSDEILIRIENEALFLEGGTPQTLCGIKASAPLGVRVIGGIGSTRVGRWQGGNGFFKDETDPNTIYTPTKDELGKTIELSYVVAQNQRKKVILKIEDSVFALKVGRDQFVRMGSPSLPLGGEVLLSSNRRGKGTWRGGNGYFENKNDPNTVYYPSKNEIGKTVTLIFSAEKSYCSLVTFKELKLIISDSKPNPTQPKPKDELPGSKKEEINDNNSVDQISISPKVGLKYRININFDADSSIILPQYFPELDRVFNFLKKYENLVVEIGGHTNGLCDDVFCNQLSLDRAKSVTKYLVRKGVYSDRIKFVGYGKKRPIDTNRNASGRRRNQRVELKVLEIKATGK